MHTKPATQHVLTCWASSAPELAGGQLQHTRGQCRWIPCATCAKLHGRFGVWARYDGCHLPTIHLLVTCTQLRRGGLSDLIPAASSTSGTALLGLLLQLAWLKLGMSANQRGSDG